MSKKISVRSCFFSSFLLGRVYRVEKRSGVFTLKSDVPLRVSWSAACTGAVRWELCCVAFLSIQRLPKRNEKGVNKKGLSGMFLGGGGGIKIGIECVGKNPNARRVTLLQLHRTGRTISDNMALRTPDFYARKRAAGVTCWSAGRTGFVFFPKAKNQVQCVYFLLDQFRLFSRWNGF